MSIAKLVRRRSKQYKIQRFDREDGYFDDEDGIWVESKYPSDTIMMHRQPINNQITDGVPGQRSLAEWDCWAENKSGNEVSNKDKITMDGAVFTVSDVKDWDVYIKFKLTRSGEAENIDDT